MISFRLVTVLVTAFLSAACASNRQSERPPPPTPFAPMTDEIRYGVTHSDRPDGWTEIFVRLNGTSTPERARDMALYYAARLGRERGADSLYVSRDRAGMSCEVIRKKNEPSFLGGGDPFFMVAVLAFVAVYSAVPGEKTWAASPTHDLQVYFSNSQKPAHGMKPLPVAETLMNLQSRFPPGDPAAAAERADSADTAQDGTLVSDARREDWIANVQANVAACEEQQRRFVETSKAPG